MKKVTGLGGIFFKCNDLKKINEWYADNLGLKTGPYGANFEWRDVEQPGQKGLTVWSAFPKDTEYFRPSVKEFMINYRVENLEALVAQLKQDGVKIVDQIAEYDYGKFVHVLDPEDNIIELWEPKDAEQSGND